jgi:hypothetical protein
MRILRITVLCHRLRILRITVFGESGLHYSPPYNVELRMRGTTPSTLPYAFRFLRSPKTYAPSAAEQRNLAKGFSSYLRENTASQLNARCFIAEICVWAKCRVLECLSTSAVHVPPTYGVNPLLHEVAMNSPEHPVLQEYRMRQILLHVTSK